VASHSETSASALNRKVLLWYTVLAIALIDVSWLYAGDWSVVSPRRLGPLLLCIGVFGLLLIERYRSDDRLRTTLLVTALLIAFSLVGSILSHLVLSVGRPLADAPLSRWDEALGFNWVSAVYWVDAHPALHECFRLAYYSGLPQVGLVVLYLGFTARFGQLHEFAELYMAGSLIAIASSLLFPAAGPWVNAAPGTPFDASALSNYFPLHSGRLRTLDLNNIQGLISMPSAHAMIGVFLMYAMRGTGAPFALSVALNTLLLVATPTEGGHYVVDVIAGISCAAALIALKRKSPSSQPDTQPFRL